MHTSYPTPTLALQVSRLLRILHDGHIPFWNSHIQVIISHAWPVATAPDSSARRVLKGGSTLVTIRTGAVGQVLFEVAFWGGERLWIEAG